MSSRATRAERPRGASRPVDQHPDRWIAPQHERKLWSVTTNSGFKKEVAGTGPSAIAEVCEHMKVFGNENAQCASRTAFEAMCAKYGVDPRVARRRATAKPRKPRGPTMSNDELANEF